MIEAESREVLIHDLLLRKCVACRIPVSKNRPVGHGPKRKILLRRGIDSNISAGELSVARRDGRDRVDIGYSGGLAVAFVVGEEKGVILPDRAADRGDELVALERRHAVPVKEVPG